MALETTVESLKKTATTDVVVIEQQIRQAAKTFKFPEQNISQLAANIAASESLQQLDAHGVNEAIYNAFKQVSNATRQTDGVTSLFHQAQVNVDHVVQAARTISEKVKGIKTAANPERLAILRARAKAVTNAEIHQPAAKTAFSGWENLATQHKVSAGLSGVCAIMAGFGALEAARSSIVHDEEGKAHMQWSQVCVAVLQTTFAAGCTYFAHEALQGRAVSF